tara:strand:- start:337 stop:588 length:252 start_codon:yes stop_codon:yes gene_type:complete
MKHRKNSKTTRILKHLLEGNSINSVDAFEKFNTTRLSSVIKHLRDSGYKISTYYRENSILGFYKMISGNRFDNQDLFNKYNTK